MDKEIETIPVNKFKSKCLGLIEEVHETGQPVIITKRGIPCVMVIPYEPLEPLKQNLFGIMKDSIRINGEILSPVWE